MFFHKKKKTKEQKLIEEKLMWVHVHTDFMLYVDDVVLSEDDQIYMEGALSSGVVKPEEIYKAVNFDGDTVGRVQILTSNMSKQGVLQGSVHTGDYMKMEMRIVSGEKEAFRRTSMLVDVDMEEFGSVSETR